MSEVLALVKFGKEEHLKMLKEGEIRFAPLSYYQNMETEMSKRGRGDKGDGVLSLKGLKNVKMVPMLPDGSYDDSKAMFVGNVNLNARLDGLDKLPIFCMSYLCNDVYDSKNKEFNKSWIKNNIKDFDDADAMMIIDNPEGFFKNICENLKYPVFHHKIFYPENETMEFYNFFDIDEVKLASGNRNINTLNVHKVAFKKDPFFKHQKEYRIVLPTQGITEPTVFLVNPIDDARIFLLKEIL